MRQSNSKVIEYDIIRLITTLLVVLGHSDFVKSYEFDVSAIISEQLNMFRFNYAVIRSWIFSFHMPLFMILSGAVFALTEKKYSVKTYIKNRIVRLIIPFLIYELIYSVPIKYFCGYFGDDNIILAYIKSIVVIITPGHLWFLYVLFIINIVFKLFVSKFGLGKTRIMGVLSLMMFFAAPFLPVYFQINRIFEYFIYFYLGMVVEKTNMREKIFFFADKHKNKFIIFIAVDILLAALYNNMGNVSYPISRAADLLLAVFGTITILVLSEKIKGLYSRCNFLQYLYNVNFDVFLFHEPLEYLILYALCELGALQFFNGDLQYLCLIILRFVVVIGVSCFLSRIKSAIKEGIKKG